MNLGSWVYEGSDLSFCILAAIVRLFSLNTAMLAICEHYYLINFLGVVIVQSCWTIVYFNLNLLTLLKT